MNDEGLDRLVAQSMYSDTDVRSLDLRAGEADLMENLMTSTTNLDRPQPLSPKPTRNRRPLFASLAVGGALLFAGTAYAVSSLSSDRTEVIERDNPCGLQADNGVLVAAADDGGQQIEYWTFDSADSHGDWVFTDAGTGGGGGCGPQTRAEAHPIAPWAEYQLEVDPDQSIYTLYGYAPGADNVEVTFNVGMISVPVGSNGYFVTRSQLPPRPTTPSNASTPSPTANSLRVRNRRSDSDPTDGRGLRSPCDRARARNAAHQTRRALIV